MKQKTFSTNKADILVVDLPEGNKVFADLITELNVAGNSWGLPKGNWQPLIFDEVTAEKIVDKQIIEGVSLYPVSSERYFMTALESLKSLIEVNVQKENPYQDDWDELCTWGHGGFAKDGKTELELYSEAEKSVFRNPYYFYKLK